MTDETGTRNKEEAAREDIRALNVEIKELRRLLKASNEERDDLRHAVHRWETRVDSLIRAIELMGESR